MSESFKQNVIFCRCFAGSCVRTSFLSRRIITVLVSSDCSSSRFTAPLHSSDQTWHVIMQRSRQLCCSLLFTARRQRQQHQCHRDFPHAWKPAMPCHLVIESLNPRHIATNQAMPVTFSTPLCQIELFANSAVQTVKRRRSCISSRSSTALELMPDNVTSANSLSAFRQQVKHTLFQQSFPDIITWHFLTVTPTVVLAVLLWPL